jgi:hypothetical protein
LNKGFHGGWDNGGWDNGGWDNRRAIKMSVYNKREKDIYNTLIALLEKNDSKLIYFKYYPKEFGNIVIKFLYNNIVHEFITDRGEVIYNQKSIFINSYNKTGKNDFEILIDIINKVVFNNN